MGCLIVKVSKENERVRTSAFYLQSILMQFYVGLWLDLQEKVP